MLPKLLYANLILKFLDLLTTYFAVSMAGVEVEANPIMNYALNSLGCWAYLANFIFFAIGSWLLFRNKAKWGLIIICVICVLVVINNLITCYQLGAI